MTKIFQISIPMTVFIIFFLFIFIVILIKRREKTNQARRPPSPMKFPIIGSLHHLVGHQIQPHRLLHRLSHDFGPLMFLQLGSVPTLVISSADVAKEIFKTNDQVLSGRPALHAVKKLSYDCLNLSFAPYGEYWREMRKLVVLELLSTKRVQSFDVIRGEEVGFMVEFILSSRDMVVNLSELTLLLANRVVCRVVFGTRSDGQLGKSKFHEILHETQDLLGEVNVADYLPWMRWLNKLNGFDSRLEKNFQDLDDFYDTVIGEHLDHRKEGNGDQEDLVDVLLRVQKKSIGQTRFFSKNQIKGILTDMFIAGTDTSAATLVWTMTELIKNPSAMRKSQQEVRELAKGKSKVDENDLPKLVYLKSVVKESLRLHPPAPLLVPRETTENCTIKGYKIPAKTRVLVNATSIGMDSKHWKDPTEFNPDRFLKSSVDFKGQDFELIPFGIGRRGCPGINFASLLVELALANLLFRFDWSLPQGMSVEDIDMGEAIGITVTKKEPLVLFASKP